ncbi:MAG: hypothetical protein IH609_08530 [Dehalococcoidia bacterium]|nr:hypothetical protein [Dehalococcoidia bacterium]
METAFYTDKELRAALERRIGQPVADAEWLVVMAKLWECGSHAPYDAKDLEEATAIYRSGIPDAVSKEASRLRLMITGTGGPGLLSQLLTAAASKAALYQAFWMAGGRPPPDLDHPDEPRDGQFQRLLNDRNLLAYPVLISLAAEILATRHRVSRHVAFCALLGYEPDPEGRTSTTWPVDVIVRVAVAAALTTWQEVAAAQPAKRFRAALEVIEAENPDATWLDKFELYQSYWASTVGRSFDNAAAFKKAAQRAMHRT